MRILGYVLGLSALLPALGFAAPAPEPTSQPDLHIRGHGCDPTYTKVDFNLDFEELGPYCFRVCRPVTRNNITSDRGQGYAYTFPGLQKPMMLGNVHQWQVINCSWSEFAGKDESQACANNSVKALYSPGKSPYDPKIKPRLGSLDFPRDYLTWAVKSFYITPIGLSNITRQATLELKGIREDGSEVQQSIRLDISTKKRFQVTNLDGKGFTMLKVLEFWLVAGGKGGYPFAIDDLSGTEYRPSPLPDSCSPPPTTTVDNGPCTPPPTTTTTWTADAEDLSPTGEVLSAPYKSLNWNSDVLVVNQSSTTPTVIPSKGKNFFYVLSGGLQISANTYEARFGVQSLDVACSFWQWTEPDYGGTNGAPCRLTFVGRRDPWDGDGLPSRVVATYSIPNPGNVTTQRFTTINLNELTDAPGKFTRLYTFSVQATIGTQNYTAMFVVDNLVFIRSIRKHEEQCRMPGALTLNFDDIPVGSSPVSLPEDYKGFKIEAPWVVISKKNYNKGTPGYIAPVSGNNALWNGGKYPDLGPSGGFDSYISPVKNFLWSFESATFTLDVPGNRSVSDVRLEITVKDACGSTSIRYAVRPEERNEHFYDRSMMPGKMQFTFAEPIIAISRMEVWAYIFTPQGVESVKVFVDDLKWRKYTALLPGCTRCGPHWSDWCEVPTIWGR